MNVSTVLPKTFTGHGYKVTVNADRSIIVKPGDWLSKYTMAIWGDASKPHIEAFKRKINGVLSRIGNPNQIQAGETLYVTGRLPGETGIFPGEDKSAGALPSTKRNVHNGLLEIAAHHFDNATRLTGAAQTQSIALGLMQFARGLMNCSSEPANLEVAVLNFGDATRLSGQMQVQRIALGLSQFAYGLLNCSADPEQLKVAVLNFDDAQMLSGQMQVQRVALGLSQFAYGLKNFSSDPGLLQTAVVNFDDAQMLDGSEQIQRIALGLWQFALSLRT